MVARTVRPTWVHVYATLSGLLGLALLVRFLALERQAIDPALLLPFTIMVLLVSYMRIPLCMKRWPDAHRPAPLGALWSIELALDSAFFCGAVLARGLAFGSWMAFVAGLITPMVPSLGWGMGSADPNMRSEGTRARWVHSAALGLLNGGRNVIALAVAWAAYVGLGGQATPTSVSSPLALALAIMFVLLVLLRNLWAWPALVLQGGNPRQSIEALFAPGKLLVELCPLPISFLVSTTLTELGWDSLLLLALAIIGLEAVLRQFAFATRALHERIDLLSFACHVHQTLAEGPQTVDALCSLAHQLCAEVVSPDRLQIGLYNGALTQVQLCVTVECGDRIPTTTLPLTPLWDWLSQNRASQLIQRYAEAAALSVDLPPVGSHAAPESAMLVPIPDLSRSAKEGSVEVPTIPPEPGDERPPLWDLTSLDSSVPLGAIVIQSVQPAAFDAAQLAKVCTIAENVGRALRRLGEAQSAPSS